MNHSARYTAPIAFLVSLTCYKTSFEKDCTLAIKFVFWNFFLHSLFTYFFFSFSQVFSVSQKKSLGNFKEDKKVSWWIYIFVERACRKAALLCQLCWNIWVIHSQSAIRKNQGLFISGLGFDLLVKAHCRKSSKNFDLTTRSWKKPKFHWNWRLRRQPAVSVPEGRCAQSCCRRLQGEFCLSTTRWTGI